MLSLTTTDAVFHPPSHAVPARKDAILVAACEHFARYGFRGASLRDIARDAGVSLTLLNHHFDNKAGLLSAVVSASRPLLQRRTDALNRLRTTGLGGFDVRDLVRACVGIEFEAAASTEGLLFLRLEARLLSDAAPEAELVRRHLEGATKSFVEALLSCYPRATHRAAASAYLCVSATLLRLLTGADSILAGDDARAITIVPNDRIRIERLLVAGIDAMLAAAELKTDGADLGAAPAQDGCEST